MSHSLDALLRLFGSHMGRERYELVAAHAEHFGTFGKASSQHDRRHMDVLVADEVPERVVDLFQVIAIGRYNRDGEVDSGLELAYELAVCMAVSHAGQLVYKRITLEFAPHLLRFGDVVAQRDDAGHVAVIIKNGLLDELDEFLHAIGVDLDDVGCSLARFDDFLIGLHG